MAAVEEGGAGPLGERPQDAAVGEHAQHHHALLLAAPPQPLVLPLPAENKPAEPRPSMRCSLDPPIPHHMEPIRSQAIIPQMRCIGGQRQIRNLLEERLLDGQMHRGAHP